MNVPADDGEELRYAEYVLGVLDAGARAEVAREVQNSSEAAAAVAEWERLLTPLAQEIAPVAPEAYVWARIHGALGLDTPPRAQARPRLWDSLPLWRWLGVGASIAAAVLLAVIMTHPRLPAPTAAVNAQYLASTITQDSGVAGWTATMDLDHARLVVVPAAPMALAAGQAPQLWLIPAGQKPISVGMIARDKPTTLVLDPELLKLLGATAVLAVSVEPPGGSPTGQPTGPVIAKGAIGGVTT
jgi:anti-sigma-K factor RskA